MRNQLKLWLAAATAIAAVSLAEPSGALGQETVDTDSLREAYRAEIDRLRQQVAQGANVFLDSSQPESERLAAVAEVGSFVDDERVRGASDIVFDSEQPAAVRVRALQLISHVAARDTSMVRSLMGVAEDRNAPTELRIATVELFQGLLAGSFAMFAMLEELAETLRSLTTDPDVEIRSRAFTALALRGDDVALERLAEGLRSPAQAPLPPQQSVRLLGLNDPRPYYELLNQIMLDPPDSATRIEAVRVLGGHGASRDSIVGYLQDSSQPEELRKAAIGTLYANDPENFHTYALPVVNDESASPALRVYAIQAVQQERTTRDVQALLARTLDEFDEAVRRLATEADDNAVRRAALKYVRAVDPNAEI